MKQHVEALVAKAAKAERPGDAMQFAQAALNAANAALVLERLAELNPTP